MDAQTLPQVVMPNHAGFTSPDPRPDVFNTAGRAARGSRRIGVTAGQTLLRRDQRIEMKAAAQGADGSKMHQTHRLLTGRNASR